MTSQLCQLELFGTLTTAKSTPRKPPTVPSVPYVRGSDTSRAAAASLAAHVSALVQAILAYVDGQAAHGATCDEIEVALGLSHQTASSRLTWLHTHGRVWDSTRRRVTRSGRRATVWVTPAYRPEAASPTPAAPEVA